jgi:hypothetical protein
MTAFLIIFAFFILALYLDGVYAIRKKDLRNYYPYHPHGVSYSRWEDPASDPVPTETN